MAFTLVPWIDNYSFCCFRIQVLLESGLIKKWKKDHWPKKTKCQDLSQISTEYHKINLFDVEGAFLMLGIGLFAGTLVFFGEIFFHFSLKFIRGILKRVQNARYIMGLRLMQRILPIVTGGGKQIDGEVFTKKHCHIGTDQCM